MTATAPAYPAGSTRERGAARRGHALAHRATQRRKVHNRRGARRPPAGRRDRRRGARRRRDACCAVARPRLLPRGSRCQRRPDRLGRRAARPPRRARPRPGRVPYHAARDAVRHAHDRAGVPLFEVHVATPVEVCALRDVKGLYARQRAGDLRGLTGVDADYEEPTHPELRIDTSDSTVDDAVDHLIALLRKENVL